MKLIGLSKITPMHSRVYDHTVGPSAKLYCLSETVPRLQVSPVEIPSTLDALDSNAIYLVDDYGNPHYPGVHVWVGRGVADTKARYALAHGEEYLKEKRAKEGPDIALSVAVFKVRQGLETPHFLKTLGLGSTV